MRTSVIMAIFIFFSGCSTHATLTITSQPDGAYIIHKESGTQYGIAPVTVYYDSIKLLKSKDSEGCYVVSGFKAIWISGVSSSLEKIRLCGTKYGTYKIGFNRNLELPGFEKDIKFELQIKSMRAQQAQARASKKAADAAFMRSIREAFRSNRLNCTSRTVGTTVYTDCY